MKKCLLLLALMGAPLAAQQTLPINESVDPALRKELYRGMVGCAAFYGAMVKYPAFSEAPKAQNDAKAAKFLSAAHLFRDDKDVTKAAVDYDDMKRDLDKSFGSDPEEQVKTVAAQLNSACFGAEQYADLALIQNYALSSK